MNQLTAKDIFEPQENITLMQMIARLRGTFPDMNEYTVAMFDNIFDFVSVLVFDDLFFDHEVYYIEVSHTWESEGNMEHRISGFKIDTGSNYLKSRKVSDWSSIVIDRGLEVKLWCKNGNLIHITYEKTYVTSFYPATFDDNTKETLKDNMQLVFNGLPVLVFNKSVNEIIPDYISDEEQEEIEESFKKDGTSIEYEILHGDGRIVTMEELLGKKNIHYYNDPHLAEYVDNIINENTLIGIEFEYKDEYNNYKEFYDTFQLFIDIHGKDMITPETSFRIITINSCNPEDEPMVSEVDNEVITLLGMSAEEFKTFVDEKTAPSNLYEFIYDKVHSNKTPKDFFRKIKDIEVFDIDGSYILYDEFAEITVKEVLLKHDIDSIEIIKFNLNDYEVPCFEILRSDLIKDDLIPVMSLYDYLIKEYIFSIFDYIFTISIEYLSGSKIKYDINSQSDVRRICHDVLLKDIKEIIIQNNWKALPVIKVKREKLIHEKLIKEV